MIDTSTTTVTGKQRRCPVCGESLWENDLSSWFSCRCGWKEKEKCICFLCKKTDCERKRLEQR